MTPDEIETAAIEAATKRHWALSYPESRCKTFDDEPEWRKVTLTHKTTEIIRAYERAMWRPVEEAPHGEPVILWSPGKDMELRPYSTGRSNLSGSSMSYHAWATHFRPLPRREGE